MIILSLDVIDIADTPLLWALRIEYIKRPVRGVKDRIMPSFQAKKNVYQKSLLLIIGI